MDGWPSGGVSTYLYRGSLSVRGIIKEISASTGPRGTVRAGVGVVIVVFAVVVVVVVVVVVMIIVLNILEVRCDSSEIPIHHPQMMVYIPCLQTPGCYF